MVVVGDWGRTLVLSHGGIRRREAVRGEEAVGASQERRQVLGVGERLRWRPPCRPDLG